MVTAEKPSHCDREIIHHMGKPHIGQGEQEKHRTTGGGHTGKDRNTMEAGEEGEDRIMSGGKGVLVALIKAAKKRRKKGEDKRGASGPTEETPWRWRALAVALAG